MESTSAATPAPGSPSSVNHTRSLIIVTILFFMWGLLTSLNDVLIPHLKSIYTLNYQQSQLVQFCFFGAYFLVSLPAGMLIKRIGYQSSAVAGLVIAAMGCALFYPASQSGYGLFLFALFVLAAGITILQVAANPYVTVLGDPQTASSRLTLTQAFNSLGTTIGPFFGGLMILTTAVLTADQISALPEAAQVLHRATEAATVQGPYLALGAALLALAVFFAFARLPKITYQIDPGANGSSTEKKSAMSYPHLILGIIGIFLYVGGEVSIGGFLVNFLGEKDVGGLPAATAAGYVSLYWGGAMVGRFVGFAVMRHVSPGRVLAFNAICVMVLILTAIYTQGAVAMWAILAVGLFNSIMFPTIFSMALHQLGKHTGQGSGFLCMGIVGGAIVPSVQGLVADRIGLHMSFFVPAACYAFILFYGLKYASLYKHQGKK